MTTPAPPSPSAPESYDLSLVIACYNEEGHLLESVREVVRTLSATHYTWELIFIDDCSSDRTRELLAQIVKDKDNMRLVLHETNLGRGGTVTEGFKLSNSRIVGFIDIDLEVHSLYIPPMLLSIDAGYDCATAYRIYKVRLNPEHLLRHILSRGYRVLFRAMLNVPLRDTETGFKFFRREAVLPVLAETQHAGWFWDTEVMVLAHLHGLKIDEIPCLFIQRPDKESTVRVVQDTRDYLKALFSFRKRLLNRR
ncbi:MAG: glycosyltransferase involved in cell wall biosynthesis [Planctomycetota bacterium]|jgi:glycosyltransferase involved in cell wall biosynthesis